MKLSEAMRLGAMSKPQAFGALVDENGGTCAIGAALDAIGVLDFGIGGYPADFAMPDEWKWGASKQTCPSCQYSSRTDYVIAHLNNDHRWTREQIADWVESIEQQQAAPVTQEEATVL